MYFYPTSLFYFESFDEYIFYWSDPLPKDLVLLASILSLSFAESRLIFELLFYDGAALNLL